MDICVQELSVFLRKGINTFITLYIDSLVNNGAYGWQSKIEDIQTVFGFSCSRSSMLSGQLIDRVYYSTSVICLHTVQWLYRYHLWVNSLEVILFWNKLELICFSTSIAVASTQLKSGPKSNGNEGVFHISLWSRARASQSDGLESYLRHSVVVVVGLIPLQECSWRILQLQPTVLASLQSVILNPFRRMCNIV